ncbi:MAG: TonB-dependent receptor [Sphingomonas bacterium]|uniref:TonB-dependent receptor n=1 Tax=Sphingomonas bacterium TaxID=1895847 RepID=UPI002637A10E|nr:TonB-dependent receptor [Sphingomonas bacterium]MDB5712541.1 TonB-dependent receptor [Sphingomonas bacterium]
MKKYELLAASAIALFTAVPAMAQTAPATTPAPTATDDYSNDVVVTATKREQTLQDVPISVAVAGAETVERAHIVDLISLQSLVPSLKVTQFQSAGQTNFTIRGFGNGNGNDGIESSVGVFIDGVYRSRSAAALDDLPEIERIEVLRGPQSTLFGKNVSAGAINIITKRPEFEWHGKAEVSVGSYGLINPRGTITGPISDTLAFRLSGSINERDGYFNNILTKRDVNERNRWSIRGDILFQPSSDFSLRILADYNVIKEVCCGAETVFNGPATLAIGAPTSVGGLGKPINDTTQTFARNLVYNTDPNNRLVGKGVSGQIDWSLGFAKLTSITAYRDQVNQTTLDVDFTGADISNLTSANHIKTFTQEFRLASEGTGPFSWLIGGFYDHENLDTGRDILYGVDARAYVNALTGGPAGLLSGLESLQAASGVPNVIPGSTYFAAGTGISDHYRMKQTSYSIFGQAEYKITDRLTITGGLAYMNDHKAATSNVVLTDRFSMLNLDNQATFAGLPFAALPASIAGCLLQKGYNPASRIVPAGPYAGLPGVPVNLFGGSLGPSLPGAGSAPCPASVGGTNPFALNALQFFYGNLLGTGPHGPTNFPNATESGILDGNRVTYAGRAAYDFGAVNAYVSYSTGWKAGAFNLSSDSRPPDANGVGRSAAPENVTVYEAGLKAKFHGGFFNIAVFKQSIKGFQTNAFTGLGFNLINAGKESVRGFEADAAYRPLRWLSLTGAVTYLDPKYDSFTTAACVDYDNVRCPINPATGLRPNFRDLTGQRPAGIPKWSASGSATISHSFGNGWGFYLRGEYDYTSNTQLTETTPPQYSTWGQSQVNASFAIQDTNDQLELMIWARNLNNDKFLLATFPTVAQTGSYSGYPNEPRTWGVTMRKSF